MYITTFLKGLMWKVIDLITIAISFGCMYLVYIVIKHLIRYHAQCQSEFAEQKEQKECCQQTVENINKELDEIEATLDAMSEAGSPDSKITPIWGSKPPKQ